MVKARNKGYRGEHELEKMLNEAGLKSKRIPMSGQASHTGDLIIELSDSDIRFTDIKKLTAEVKSWKRNFSEYDWLNHSDIVFKRTCRLGTTKPWLVVMTLEMFLEMVK